MEISKNAQKVVWELMWNDYKRADDLIAELTTEEVIQLRLAMQEWVKLMSTVLGLRLYVEPVTEEEIRGKYEH